MPRKGHIAKRDVLPDPIYNNKVVTKLINNIMLDGKKGVAQKIVYGAFDRIAEETGKDALEVFTEAMNNIMPALEVKARRIGGATYQVPIDVRPDRRQALALRWITLYSRKRSEKTMEERLAKELMDAANNTGASVKKKRRYAQNGRSKQSFRTLQILISYLHRMCCIDYAAVRIHFIGGKKPWLEENIHLREPEILVLWPTLMLVRQH